MMMLLHLLLAVFGTAAAFPSYKHHVVKQVYEFPPGSWLENLAVRSNGHILATRLDEPILYQFSLQGLNSTPATIHTFTSSTGITGITELKGYPDVFAVAIYNFSSTLPNATNPSTNEVWQVDMRHAVPIVTKIAQLANASVPNGMASLAADEHAVLISDSTLGSVWRLDLVTGAYTKVISDPKMEIVLPGVTVGVNGIRIFSDYLYFTNSFGIDTSGPFLARIPIYANGTASGPSEVVGYSLRSDFMFDDFAIDGEGVAYVATGTGNVVTKILPDGTVSVVAGGFNSTVIASPTSVQFGRGEGESGTIYVTTAGGDEALSGTIPIVGAQLVSINIG